MITEINDRDDNPGVQLGMNCTVEFTPAFIERLKASSWKKQRIMPVSDIAKDVVAAFEDGSANQRLMSGNPKLRDDIERLRPILMIVQEKNAKSFTTLAERVNGDLLFSAQHTPEHNTNLLAIAHMAKQMARGYDSPSTVSLSERLEKVIREHLVSEVIEYQALQAQIAKQAAPSPPTTKQFRATHQEQDFYNQLDGPFGRLRELGLTPKLIFSRLRETLGYTSGEFPFKTNEKDFIQVARNSETIFTDDSLFGFADKFLIIQQLMYHNGLTELATGFAYLEEYPNISQALLDNARETSQERIQSSVLLSRDSRLMEKLAELGFRGNELDCIAEMIKPRARGFENPQTDNMKSVESMVLNGTLSTCEDVKNVLKVTMGNPVQKMTRRM